MYMNVYVFMGYMYDTVPTLGVWDQTINIHWGSLSLSHALSLHAYIYIDICIHMHTVEGLSSNPKAQRKTLSSMNSSRPMFQFFGAYEIHTCLYNISYEIHTCLYNICNIYFSLSLSLSCNW